MKRYLGIVVFAISANFIGGCQSESNVSGKDSTAQSVGKSATKPGANIGFISRRSAGKATLIVHQMTDSTIVYDFTLNEENRCAIAERGLAINSLQITNSIGWTEDSETLSTKDEEVFGVQHFRPTDKSSCVSILVMSVEMGRYAEAHLSGPSCPNACEGIRGIAFENGTLNESH